MSVDRPLIVIAAMTRDRVIGSRNGMPWNIPEEYRQFLDHVRGNAVLIGRTSHQIFGKDLGESRTVVVSRSVSRLPGVDVSPSVEAAVEVARSYGTPKLFSAGGASIYRQTVPIADAMYLSFIKGEYVGDARFPEFDESDWTVERTVDHTEFEYREYVRR